MTTEQTEAQKPHFKRADFSVSDIERLAVPAKLSQLQRALAVTVASSTYSEAADKFGLNIGTVKSRVSRIRERLAKAKESEQ